MKRIVYHLFALSLLLSLGSCFYPSEPLHPRPEPWLCSVNADGTGFRRIKKVDLSFGTTGFWDIYMTKDDRIIFYGEKLWISDPDTLSITPITPYNLVMFDKPQLEFTRDGETAYFAASRDLYRMKLSTNEPFKITETPEDYYWAEPMLSDNERYISIRGYWGKKGESETVYSYVDLTDYSLHNVFAVNYVAAPYKGKIIESQNRFFLENKHGFGSINFEDSLFTLHQPYVSSYKNMFETSSDQRYILTRYKQSTSSYAIAIDLNDFTQYELGKIYEHISSNPIKACKDTNLVFFRDEDHIYKYDLDTHTKSLVIGPSDNLGVGRIIMHTPTWDGSKVYFYAEISVH